MQAETLSRVIYDQILYGRYSLGHFASEVRRTFVELGFVRHQPGTEDTVLDEPLAILAAQQWLNKHAKLSSFACLRHDITRHSHRKNGFEAYLTFHLRKVFETSPVLDTIFSFRSDFAGRQDLTWQRERFELVTVVAGEGDANPNTSIVSPSCGPSSPGMGFLANGVDEVLEWISTNTDQFTFCFPTEEFGPDVLFFLRCKRSGQLLLAAAQCKHYETVQKEDLIHGVRAVTPSWFLKSKDQKVCESFIFFRESLQVVNH